MRVLWGPPKGAPLRQSGRAEALSLPFADQLDGDRRRSGVVTKNVEKVSPRYVQVVRLRGRTEDTHLWRE